MCLSWMGLSLRQLVSPIHPRPEGTPAANEGLIKVVDKKTFPWIRIHLAMQEMQGPSLDRELRSHGPRSN